MDWTNTNTTAVSGPSPVGTMAKLWALAKEMKQVSVEHFSLLTHPANVVAYPQLREVPLRVSDFIPERDISERWIPPKGDRFVEYGPEDEYWMRPAGLGTVEKIDLGPLMYKINEKVLADLTNQIFEMPIVFTPMENRSPAFLFNSF